MNQWGRHPMGKDSRTLVFGIVIIGIIGYLLIPNFFKSIYSSINPTNTVTSLNNVNPPSTAVPNALDSSGNPIQNSSSVNNTLVSGNGDNTISSGYWILFVANGAFQQISVNAQDYAFVQGLIQSDSKGIKSITVFLVTSGQIHQYVVSNETSSVICNMAAINMRATNATPTPTPTPTATPTPTETITPTPTPNTTSITTP